MHLSTELAQVVLDLAAVFVAAVSGGLVGVRRHFDLFGILVVAAVTGLGGGIVRDLLIGAVPPPGLVDWRYLAMASLGGTLAFFFHPALDRRAAVILIVDAGALALFTVAGTTKALSAGLPPIAAALLGLLTGIGGGVLRDVLVGQVPVVFQRELYALPSLSGAVLLVAAARWGWIGPGPIVLAAVAILAFRLLALRRNWNAPRPRGTEGVGTT